MNKMILFCYLLGSLIIHSSENPDRPHHHHHHHKNLSLSEVIVNLNNSNVQLEMLKEEHEVALKKSKIKVAAITTIVTALISSGVALLIHYTTGSCSK